MVLEEEQERDQLHEEEEDEGDNEDAAVIHRPRAVRRPRGSRDNRAQDQAGHAQNNFVLTW